MLREPVCARCLLQYTRLFKQMDRTGYQDEFLLAVQQRIRLLVQHDQVSQCSELNCFSAFSRVLGIVRCDCQARNCVLP